MTLALRIIPRLDIKGPNLVKGMHLEGLRVLGYPEFFARKYFEENIDEIIFQRTLEYYANHPSELEEIYADVIEGITEERSTLNPQ